MTDVIAEVWERLSQRLATETPSQIGNMKAAFVGALYAASSAITVERAHAREISEAAFRIERSPL